MDSVSGLIESDLSALGVLSIPLNGFPRPTKQPLRLYLCKVLSIPLNGFMKRIESQGTFTIWTFNSIEWIPDPIEYIRNTNAQYPPAFNSIEWIQFINPPVLSCASLSIPLNGFDR